MDLLERQVPCEGFVRRIASSFSNKINCNDKTKSNFQKYPLSRNSFSFSGAPMQKALSPSVADIKKILESSQNTSKNIEKVEKKSNRSKSLVNRITSSLRSKPNEQIENKSLPMDQKTQFQVEETLNGIQIQIKQPHLISVIRNNTSVPSTNKTSIRIYPLKQGRTTIGSATTNDIILHGPGIEEFHCYIENLIITVNKRKTKTSKSHLSVNSAILYPISRLCAVEGVLTEAPYRVNSGSMICLGESEYFRYNHPGEESLEEDEEESNELEDIILANSDNSEVERLSFRSLNISTSSSEKNQSMDLTNESQNTDDLEHSNKDQKVKASKDNHKIQSVIKNNWDNDANSETNDKQNKAKRTVRFNLSNLTSESTKKEKKHSKRKPLTNSNIDSETIDSFDNKSLDLTNFKGNVRDLNRIFSNKETKADSKQAVNNRRTCSPSKTFLSTISKFEQLAKGTKSNEKEQALNIQNEAADTTEIKQNMFVQRSDLLEYKSSFHNRDIKSKSFGCEKELHDSVNEKQQRSNLSNKNGSGKSKSKNKRSKKAKNLLETVEVEKPKPLLIDSLNYIDDDEISNNELKQHVGGEDFINDDDSDGNDALIDDFKGCDGNEENDTNPEDSEEDDFDSTYSSVSEFNPDLKTRSAPITPTRMSPTMQMPNNNESAKSKANKNTSSFIYNMNLYDDHNFQLLNEKENFERECTRLSNKRSKKLAKSGQKQGKSGLFDDDNDHLVNVSSLSSSDSSISSLNGVSLEPLVIQEETDSLETSTNYIQQQQQVKMRSSDLREYGSNVINEKIYEETEEEIAEMMENENLIAQTKNTRTSTSSSSSSSSTSLQITSVSENADSEELKSKTTESPKSLIPTCEIDDSFNDTDDHTKSSTSKSHEKQEAAYDEEDKSQVSQCSESTFTETMLSPSQIDLKDSYIKAKRERQMEQEQAELEKVRLQEILDICMEFQRQEDIKSNIKQNDGQDQNSTLLRDSCSTSPSISSSSSAVLTPTTPVSILKTLSNDKQKQNDFRIKESSQEEVSHFSSGSSINTGLGKEAEKVLNQDMNVAKNTENFKAKESPVRGSAIVNKNAEIPTTKTGNLTQQQKRQLNRLQTEQLTREKCEVTTSLNFFKQKIKEIEMRQNQAIRDLEMERALLDVEHNNQFKNIQNDEAKLKHLQQEHQLRIEAFNMHTAQIRSEIDMVQMTMKNVENEILILDTNIDASFIDSGLSYNEQKHLDSLKHQKQHALEESKRTHEDLEFQLMELEAKYESELEDIQNRLIKEQDNLLNAFKQRQTNLNDYDRQQTEMLIAVKAETEYLEVERQKLIEQFKKQRNLLQQIEKKLQKLQEQEDLVLQTQAESSFEQTQADQVDSAATSNRKSPNRNESPSPASSSVSLSSSINTSSANTPPPISVNGPINASNNHGHIVNSNRQNLDTSNIHNQANIKPTLKQNQVYHQQFNQQQHSQSVTLTPNRYIPPSSTGRFNTNNMYSQQQMSQNANHMQHLHNQLANQNSQKGYSQQFNKQLSQSFRDILENTLLINGFNDMIIQDDSNTNNVYQQHGYYRSNTGTMPKPHKHNNNGQMNGQHRNYGKGMNLSSSSLNTRPMYYDSSADQQFVVLNDTLGSDGHSDKSSSNSDKNAPFKAPETAVNTQIAMKFAELERTLAKTKAENNNLLEQQLIARERELQLLQDEKQKRSDLERQLNDEIQMREKIVEENIQLRHKKPTQARPLTRYLPVRDNNFDLRQHVENSGHHILNHIDPSTKQPLIQINSHSCRGYLLKMGQKFKTWNKRWFVFDRQKRTLCYYMDKHETKLRGSIYFQSINEVYVDHMKSIKSPDSKSTFVAKTFDRNFHLVAPSSELMRVWVEVIITGAEGYLEYND